MPSRLRGAVPRALKDRAPAWLRQSMGASPAPGPDRRSGIAALGRPGATKAGIAGHGRERVPLNAVCNLEDWEVGELSGTIRRLLPYLVSGNPEFPDGMEHRKHWEFAQITNGLARLGVLSSSAWVLAVAAGQEEVAFDLTNDARWVFVTDIYGTGDFAHHEAASLMLVDPDSVARCAYNRRRLVVQYMDALDLRYEDATFDAVYSLSSIEHFGGMEGARKALAEQRRVLRRGGIAAITTEVIVNGAPSLTEGNLTLFTPEQMVELAESVPGLELVEPIDFWLSDRTRSTVVPLEKAWEDARRHGRIDYPHIVLEHRDRHFTSVSVFLRVRAS